MKKKFSILNIVSSKYILIILLIISIIFNINIYNNYKKQSFFINRYHLRMINQSKRNLSLASDSIKTCRRVTDKYRKTKYLLIASEQLKTASDYIEDYSIYFDYIDKDEAINGNIHVSRFFKVYTMTLENWAETISKNLPNAPSEEDITNMYNDLQNISYKFQSSAEKLTHEELITLIYNLVDETTTKEVGELLKEKF